MAKNTADREFDVTGELTEDLLYIKIDHAPAYRRLFSALLGHTLRVRFVIFRAKRSDAQNRYIHGVVVPVVRVWLKEMEGVTYTHDEVYTWLRVSLLGQTPEIKEIAGQQVIVMTGKRFSQQNTKEFAESVELIVAKMAEKGCVIPLPRENNFISDFLQDD